MHREQVDLQIGGDEQGSKRVSIQPIWKRSQENGKSLNPLGQQKWNREKKEKAGEEKGSVSDEIHLMVKSFLEAAGSKVDLEQKEERQREDKSERGLKGERKAAKPFENRTGSVAEGLTRVVRPQTSEKESETGDGFWRRFRQGFFELERQYPFRVWGMVFLLLGVLVTFLILVSNMIDRWRVGGEEEELAAVVKEEKVVAPEVTLKEMVQILGGGMEVDKASVRPDAGPATRYLRAVADYRAGNFLKAVDALEKASVAGNPTRSAEQAFLAYATMVGIRSAFSISGEADEKGVLENIQSSLQADPVNIFAWRLLALWQRRNNQEEEAIRTLEATRLLADADGQRAELEIQLAIARVGTVATMEEARALELPAIGVARIAASAACESLWGKREKAIAELGRLVALMGKSSTIAFLADPVFQTLALTDMELASLGQSAEENPDGK